MVISRRRTAANGNVAELYSLAVDSKHPLARFERNQIRRFRLRIGIGVRIGFRIGFAHMHGTGCRHRTVCRRDFGGSGSHGRHKTRFGDRRELLGIRRPHHVVGGIRRRRRCGELQSFADCKFFFRTIEHNRSRRDAGIAVIVRAGGQSAQAANAKSKSFFIVRLLLSMFVK